MFLVNPSRQRVAYVGDAFEIAPSRTNFGRVAWRRRDRRIGRHIPRGLCQSTRELTASVHRPPLGETRIERVEFAFTSRKAGNVTTPLIVTVGAWRLWSFRDSGVCSRG